MSASIRVCTSATSVLISNNTLRKVADCGPKSPYGWKLARLYARLEARVFRPALTVMNAPPVGEPGPLNKAVQTIDTEINRLLAQVFPMRKAA